MFRPFLVSQTLINRHKKRHRCGAFKSYAIIGLTKAQKQV
ncbi:Hypothetical protein I595_2591 [Croceitalea dokdonensis DOKDO 023]|uniref:Uncharacterized protein n=1 Tax=Croceitalea dokdonensis DOKDO 023 TaxID=1300341 RepID=A0A0P7AU03_9FLAO|nr:Hypothetical protein I595_2591 [Croceitalea dokdonensis DOKDO 023]